MKADAKTIAVPTADVDAKARNQRLKHWFDMGMNVLNVAAFFVPGLNTVMLGVFAYDLMSSVFTGFEAWEEGDSQQALVQLESLAINAAVIAGFAVGAKIVQASGFVDALTSVWHEDQEVLWHPDMKPYASPAAVPEGVQPDSLGHVHVDGKTYLKLDGTLYEVFRTLSNNGACATPMMRRLMRHACCIMATPAGNSTMNNRWNGTTSNS